MAEDPKFDPELFEQVVKSNLDMLRISITEAAAQRAIKYGNCLMSEDKVRKEAVKFFRKQLAQELYLKLP